MLNTRRSWLDSLKAGDLVVWRSPADDLAFVRRIARVTKTKLVLESGGEFDRRTGRLYGAGRTAGFMRPPRLEQPDEPSAMAAVVATELRSLRVEIQHAADKQGDVLVLRDVLRLLRKEAP